MKVAITCLSSMFKNENKLFLLMDIILMFYYGIIFSKNADMIQYL